MKSVLDSLVERARLAQPEVATIGIDGRLERAAKAAAALRRAAPAIIDSAVAEIGQPRRFARREIESALDLLDALPVLAEAIRPAEVPAAAGRTILEWQPYGVVFGWHAANSPVWVPTLVTQSALVSGNTVVSRPSGRAQATTGLVLDALLSAWPTGAVVRADLTAPEAQRLIVHPGIDVVVAHSSTETCKRHLALLGEAYAKGAPLRPYIPEASGNDPLLVLPGADLEVAAQATALAAFANGGQLCMSAKRIIVARSEAEQFIAHLVRATAALVMGDPGDEATDIGPLSDGPAREQARVALAEALAAGGELVVGDGERGAVFAPTIVRLPLDALQVDLWQRESFAPLRSLVVADDVEHAIRLANDTAFGLGAAVFGGTPEDVARVRAARVVVDTSPLYQDAHLVVGGVGESGLAGARPKIEQFVYARRVHYETP
ncbi:MAG: aldehyde dehydrogenase [Thermoleophilia bacterium]|nr:aldehyde dehydrogenase [Thermoleophilia bacterium]